MTAPTPEALVSAYLASANRAHLRYGLPGLTRSGRSPSDAARYHRINTPEYRARAIEGARAAIEAGPGGRVVLCNAGGRAVHFATVAAIAPDGIILQAADGQTYRRDPEGIAAVGTREHQSRIPIVLSAGDRVLVRDRGNLAERIIPTDGTYRVVYPDGPDGNAVVEDVHEAFPFLWPNGGTVPPRVRILDGPPEGFAPPPDDVVWVEQVRGGRTSVPREDLVPADRLCPPCTEGRHAHPERIHYLAEGGGCRCRCSRPSQPTAVDVNEANDRIVADRLARGEW